MCADAEPEDVRTPDRAIAFRSTIKYTIKYEKENIHVLYVHRLGD